MCSVGKFCLNIDLNCLTIFAGFFLSTLFSNYGDAMHGAIGSFLPIMFLSGIIWPLEGLPLILQKISWYLPLTAAVQAMRGVMARGWNISYLSAGIGITTAWISIFMTLSWVAMKIRTK